MHNTLRHRQTDGRTDRHTAYGDNNQLCAISTIG